MRIIIFFLLWIFPAQVALTQHNGLMERELGNGEEDMFVHPFLAHMGLPEMPNEVTLRLTAMNTRIESETQSDFGVHIEAGLVNRIGLHIRSDGIRREEFSEVMLQFAVLADEEMNNGVAIFGQLDLPTGEVEKNTYKGLFGATFRFRISDILLVDGNIHYDPREEMAEHETAFVFRANARYYPIFEVRGHFGEEEPETYMLTAIKFLIGEHHSLGAGFQAALSDDREFDTEALFTYDIGF